MISILNIAISSILSVVTVSLLPHFRIFLVVPLVPLFFVIPLSYFRKGFEPLLLASMIGFVFDLGSPYFFGYYILLFLLTAAAVRYFFDEGLRALTFGAYLLICGGAVLVFELSQLAIIWAGGVKPTLSAILPVILALGVNLVFAVILYPASIWYFEKLVILEDYLKRR